MREARCEAGWGDLSRRVSASGVTPPRGASLPRRAPTLPLQGRVTARGVPRMTTDVHQMDAANSSKVIARSGHGSCDLILATPIRVRALRIIRPRNKEGAGKAGCWLTPMARLQKKMQAAVTTG